MNSLSNEVERIDRANLSMEYTSLRNEILKRIELRQQYVALTLTIAAAILGFGLTTPIITLIYPPLAGLLAMAWGQNEYLAKEIAAYIREKYETPSSGLGWETYMQRLRVDRPKFSFSWRRVSHGGIFILTQLMAILIALFSFAATSLEWALLAIDIISVMFVTRLFWRSR